MRALFGSARGPLRRRMLGAAALTLGIAATAGCDGIVAVHDPQGPETVAGTWTGNAGTDALEMTLRQPDSLTVAGFGVIQRPGSALAFRVEGIRDSTRVTLLLDISVPGANQTGSALAHFRGRFIGAHRIEGTLAGAGYSDTAMILRRERQSTL